jgi:hypothetical protein
VYGYCRRTSPDRDGSQTNLHENDSCEDWSARQEFTAYQVRPLAEGIFVDIEILPLHENGHVLRGGDPVTHFVNPTGPGASAKIRAFFDGEFQVGTIIDRFGRVFVRDEAGHVELPQYLADRLGAPDRWSNFVIEPATRLKLLKFLRPGPNRDWFEWFSGSIVN